MANYPKIKGIFVWISLFLAIALGGYPPKADWKHIPIFDGPRLSLDSLLAIEISAATKYAQKPSETPASITIITAEEIKRFGYQTLEDVFKSIRGFYVTNDRNYTYLGVRGFGRPSDYNDRILLLINGHTTNENVYGGALLGTEFGLDLEAIERIEIVRGPTSALYGTGAMFAVVNVITKEGKNINGLKLANGFGSYGNLSLASAYGKELTNDLDIFISGKLANIKGQDLYFPEYDSVNGGIARGLDWDKYGGILARMSYKSFELTGIFTSRKKGIPTGAFGVVFNAESTWSLDERSFIELKSTHRLGIKSNIILRGYFNWYHYKGAYPYEVLSFDESFGNWFGLEVSSVFDWSANNRCQIGTEYQYNPRADYRLWDIDTIYFDQNFPSHLISFYLTDEYQLLSNLGFNLGIRQDNYLIQAKPQYVFSPRGAIIYNPWHRTTLKLLYGQAFRIPNVYEANYSDPLFGHKRNPNLQPEKIETYEVNWEQRVTNEIFGVLSVYKYQMRDLIDMTLDEKDSLTQFQNIGRVLAFGLETELRVLLRNGKKFYCSYAWQGARDWLPDSSKRLSNSPEHIAKCGVIWQVGPVYLAPEIQYETERRTVYDTKTQPYLLTNLTISTLQLFNHWQALLSVRNLFDTEYELPGGFEHQMPAIKQNGRNFIAKLEVKF